MTLAAGAAVGPYKILGLLGKGGMGEVYTARDERLERDVAVKILHSAYAADPDRLRRFDHEARAAAALNHPNILALYDTGTYEGTPYLVSEILHGQTLRDLLGHGALVQRRAVEYGIAVAPCSASANAPRPEPRMMPTLGAAAGAFARTAAIQASRGLAIDQ